MDVYRLQKFSFKTTSCTHFRFFICTSYGLVILNIRARKKVKLLQIAKQNAAFFGGLLKLS